MEEKLLTPQQEQFLANYTDPKSPTFSNAVQSALKAGYTENYANNITGLMPDWLFDSIGDMQLVKQATKNLKEFLSDEETDRKIKSDMTKFTLERLNKKKYATKSETEVNLSDDTIKAITGMKIIQDDTEK